jgi:hypothetical protein
VTFSDGDEDGGEPPFDDHFDHFDVVDVDVDDGFNGVVELRRVVRCTDRPRRRRACPENNRNDMFLGGVAPLRLCK